MDDDLKARVAAWAAENPDGASVLRAEGAAAEREKLLAQHAPALAAAQSEGAIAERQRVAAIRATVPPGFSQLADSLIESGADHNVAAHAVCQAMREQHEAAALLANSEAVSVSFVEAAKSKPAEPMTPLNPFEISDRANSIMNSAKAEGSSLTLLEAIAQATSELSQSQSQS
jgi:hypothetical protein